MVQKLFIIILIASTIFPLTGKEKEVSYWNCSFTEEVPKKDASYSKSITTYQDGRSETEIIDLNSKEIINREIFKDQEPYGIWLKKNFEKTDTIDYNFQLVYSNLPCPEDSLPQKLELFLYDDPAYGYIAPCIATGENNLPEYMHKRMFSHYPDLCNDTTLVPQKVIVEFTITNKGKVTGISIIKNANSLYDKEAFRLVRELAFSNPAFINGIASELCIRCPVLFNRLLICPPKSNKTK